MDALTSKTIYQIDVPTEVVEAAGVVHIWMNKNTSGAWVFMGLASRSLLERMELERKSACAELEKLQTQLDLSLQLVREATAAIEKFKADVFKLTTPASIEHVSNQSR